MRHKWIAVAAIWALGAASLAAANFWDAKPYNEWSQKDALSSPWILRMLSATHCRRQFPHYVVSHLETLRQAANGRTLEAIDIGCGPISRLRWGQLAGYLRVTGVDPLLDMYAVLHERHGLNGIPSLRCAREISAFAETLTEHLPAAGYDFAYSSNALDHTSDPAGIVRSLMPRIA